MRICLIARNGYPYTFSETALLAQSIIEKYQEQEFILLSILDDRSMSKKFPQALPPNVMEVHEVYLGDKDWGQEQKRKKNRLSKEEQEALRSLIFQQKIQWDFLFEYFKKSDASIDTLLMGEDFYRLAFECYQLKYPSAIFCEYLKNLRLMYLPLFLMMKMQVPKADLYCCFDAGYAGVLGSMGKYFYQAEVLLLQHGRQNLDAWNLEIEEWLAKRQIQGIGKRLYLRYFKNLEQLALASANEVVCFDQLLQEDFEWENLRKKQGNQVITRLKQEKKKRSWKEG